MKMATTTFDYDYNDINETYTTATLCSRDSDNKLGAQLSILYYFMFLFSVFGNGLVLVIIHRFEKLTTVTNIFLLNLVMSSLIFMSSLPFMGVYMQISNWIFGTVMCKIVGSVYYLGFYSSVLFLTLLSFDRHLAVVYSLGAPRVRNTRYAVISCAVVWLVSGLACIKPMILHTTFFNYLENKTHCQEYPRELDFINVQQLRKSGFYIELFVFLIFPLVVIICCYVRIAVTVVSSKIITKFKTVRLIFIIVLLFFICWTPFNIVLLIHNESSTCEDAQKKGYALQITRILAYIYFCISPIFYTFVGKKFQNYFRQLLVKHFPGLRRCISTSQCNNISTKSTPNDF
ncbi:C-C chemokine receptor type 1-like [Mastacembelus armatus]|uniref:C-C chemokine receptor type 1-like n=1 Tax=Mastacembelus armatus TaxID=205130 RepID=A0A3Q3N718_9TELE|nr:C-C chemokine receptor type 1-like [Mastacembelus armatus]XP_026148321.1 C-C chemokine receptor type 1-like [Mastacembelus armatus]XP_026148322.1 C-C chemokine receptor type 1-like [Mastacembelus armatus]